MSIHIYKIIPWGLTGYYAVIIIQQTVKCPISWNVSKIYNFQIFLKQEWFINAEFVVRVLILMIPLEKGC